MVQHSIWTVGRAPAGTKKNSKKSVFESDSDEDWDTLDWHNRHQLGPNLLMKQMAPANIKINPVGLVICLVIISCVCFYMFGLPRWFKTEQRVSMKQILSASIALAERGGNKVREIRSKDELEEKVKGKTLEGAKEMLTSGDIESHRAIVYGFAKAFPGLKVISEEHDLQPVNLAAIESVELDNSEVASAVTSDQSIPIDQITVWIDPLDATQEYTEKLDQYVTTMVCVAVNGEPTIGVVHKPFLKETVWAWVGYGLSSSVKKSDLKVKGDDEPKTIIMSRSHPGQVQEVVKNAFGEKTQVVPAGGAGYKTLEVIRGKADAYVHVTRIKKWDICAGNAILSAIDGKMTTVKGDRIDYSGVFGPVVDGGLVATVYNHRYYLDKLKDVNLEELNAKKPS